jgi:hypothetical protein
MITANGEYSQPNWHVRAAICCAIAAITLVAGIVGVLASRYVQYRESLANEERRALRKVSILVALYDDLYEFEWKHGLLPHLRERCEECGQLHSWRRVILHPYEYAHARRRGWHGAKCAAPTIRYAMQAEANRTDIAAVAGSDTAFSNDGTDVALEGLPRDLVIALALEGAVGSIDDGRDFRA